MRQRYDFYNYVYCLNRNFLMISVINNLKKETHSFSRDERVST